MIAQKAFDRIFHSSLIVLAAIYCIGMRMHLMDIDSAQYALISKEMFLSGNYLQVHCAGADYLDKPPLLFWISCLSFEIFGIHDWAFRLPSVLVLAFGIYSVYRYAKIYYPENTAKLASLIMASTCAAYLMTHDVRTDTMLTGWVMFSIWQLAEFNNNQKFKNIFFAAIGIGLAMLTKGPIGLIIPVTAFSFEFIYKREWRKFFRWQYLVALLIIALMLAPMSYGLYQQFDLHPEKEVYSMKGPSGLRFFYWTQSFGRITGESYWNNNPDPFFLFHSFLWSFLPWTVFFLPSIYSEVKAKIKNFKSPSTEAISVGGFILVLLFFSRSKYQLPHYTFCIHPLAAVITAKYLGQRFFSEQNLNSFRITYRVHVFVMSAILILCFILIYFVFPAGLIQYLIFFSALVAFIYFNVSKKNDLVRKTIFVTLIPCFVLTFMLNTHFYPTLFSYQSGSNAGKDLGAIQKDGKQLMIFAAPYNFSLEFYSNAKILFYNNSFNCKLQLMNKNTYVLVDSANLAYVKSMKPGARILKKYPDFSVTQLSPQFLDPNTRAKAIQWVNLVGY